MPDSDITDLTIEILRDIRDDIRGTNQRLDATNQRLDVTIARLDTTIQRLDTTNERLDTTVQRLDTTIERLDVLTHETAASVRKIVRYVKDKQGKEIEDLQQRVTRLEAKKRN